MLSEGLKGRGYPLAGTLGELLSLAWVAVALAVFVPLWGIYGAAVALASSYVVSLVMLVVLAGAARRAGVGQPVAFLASSRPDRGGREGPAPGRGRLPGHGPPRQRLVGWSACGISSSHRGPGAAVDRLAQGCGIDEAREGPPFEPENIDRPGVPSGHRTATSRAVGAVNALRRHPPLVAGAAAARRRGGVRRSYAEHITQGARRSARSTHLQPRYSQPIEPEVETQGNRATVEIVRPSRRLRFVATRRAWSRITDFPVAFFLVARAPGGSFAPTRSAATCAGQRNRRRLATQD